MRSSIKKYIPLFIAFCIITALFIIAGINNKKISVNSHLYTLNDHRIINGVSINKVDVSGLNYNEATVLLKNYIDDNIKDKRVTFYLLDKKFIYKYNDIGITYDFDKSIQFALMLGRDGSFFENLLEKKEIKKNTYHIVMDYLYDKNKLETILRVIENDIKVVEKNASIVYNSGNYYKTPHVLGVYIDKNNTINNFNNAILSKNLKDIEIISSKKLPDVTTSCIDNITSVISEFNTYYSTKVVNRSKNIEHACNFINNTIIMSGETISVDSLFQKRTEENGYLSATTIIQNQMQEGIGGGICQVSTTIYNAALLACLEIVERHPHSLIISYIPPGRDAAISEGYLDLKLKNNKKTPILITATAINGELKILFHGIKEDNNIIKLRHIILRNLYDNSTTIEYDPLLEDNEIIIVQKAVSGLEVAVFRDIFKANGTIIASEDISKDIYLPKKRKIKVSTSHRMGN